MLRAMKIWKRLCKLLEPLEHGPPFFWTRAFDSMEHMKICEKAKTGMAAYVTTMQAAENS